MIGTPGTDRAMNPHEQLRVYRGDLEVGSPPTAQEVLRWASTARPFCAACRRAPLYEVNGGGLSGRTRARSIIDQALARGIIARTRQVHCEQCPPAEVVVQLGVLGVLAALPGGEAWCLRYGHHQPGAVAVRPSEARLEGTRYGVEWLDAAVCDWLEARVVRWGWALAQWCRALEGGPIAVEASRMELVLVADAGRTRVRWHPGVRVHVERLMGVRAPLLEALDALDLASGEQLGVDLITSEDLASRGLGELVRAGR